MISSVPRGNGMKSWTEYLYLDLYLDQRIQEHDGISPTSSGRYVKIRESKNIIGFPQWAQLAIFRSENPRAWWGFPNELSSLYLDQRIQEHDGVSPTNEAEISVISHRQISYNAWMLSPAPPMCSSSAPPLLLASNSQLGACTPPPPEAQSQLPA